MNCEKLGSPARATFKNPRFFLSNGKIFKVQPKTNSQKIPILNLWMNWENFCPNLRFTVENKIGNLHKIRLLMTELSGCGFESSCKAAHISNLTYNE